MVPEFCIILETLNFPKLKISLEERAQNGKIPKYQYRLMKKLSFANVIEAKRRLVKSAKRESPASRKRDPRKTNYQKKKNRKRKNDNKPWKKHRDEAEEFDLDLGQRERFGKKRRRRRGRGRGRAK